eukprot:4973447-Alexandrium_andersonii.AAC.1
MRANAARRVLARSLSVAGALPLPSSPDLRFCRSRQARPLFWPMPILALAAASARSKGSGSA